VVQILLKQCVIKVILVIKKFPVRMERDGSEKPKQWSTLKHTPNQLNPVHILKNCFLRVVSLLLSHIKASQLISLYDLCLFLVSELDIVSSFS